MLTTTMNGIFELMSKPSELNSSVLNTYTDSLKNLFDFDTSIDGSHIIVDTIQSIVDELTTKINGPISSSTPNILPYNDAVN
ncbi:hypothetical protein FACS1894166_06480 [Bacilli bacterium]|nr:hypothetical protein FACS1894166_06480 [Bacilli bacterium]